MISKELLEELKIIMKEDYGIDLAPDALAEFANMLVSMFGIFTNIEYGNQGGTDNE